MRMPLIPAADPAPSPVPGPRASVSTPDGDEFQSVWDSTRRPGDADRTREIGANGAETAPTRTPAARKSEPDAANHGAPDDPIDRDEANGSVEGAAPRSEEESQASGIEDDSEPVGSIGGDVLASSLDPAAGVLPPVTGMGVISDGSFTSGSESAEVTRNAGTGDWSTDPGGARRIEGRTMPGSPLAEAAPDGMLSGRPPVIASADADDPSSVPPSVKSSSGVGTPTPIASETAPAPTSSEPATPNSNAPATSTPSRPQPAAMPIPEGFQAVTPTPGDARILASAQSATAHARSTTERPRPNASNADQAPAAVARAGQVNRSIEAGRGGESALKSEGVVPGGVIPAPAADANASVTRLSAQTLPTGGAETALPTSGEGPARTMPGVARGLDALSRQKGGSLVMRLDPPQLGQLRLEMRMEGGRVTVLMAAATESARSLLQTNLGSLRTALEDRGLAVDRLVVESAARPQETTSNGRSENRSDGQDARGGQDASGRQDAGDGRSRGRRDDASNRERGRGDDPGRQEAADFKEALAGAGTSDH